MLYGGNFLPASEAGAIGLVDSVVPRETVETRAIEMLSGWISLPQPAFSAIKANRVEAVQTRYTPNLKEKSKEFLDCWFSRATRELLEKAAEKF